LRLLIAIMLLVTVTPGVTEVVEGAMHLIAHADLPHHEDGEAAGGACDEHTCTPLFHACGCHSTMAARAEVAISAPSQSRSCAELRLLRPSTRVGRVEEPPPLRPPIV
jgi:hypothetical protein